MSKPQKIVVLIGVATVALMLLFPSWKYVRDTGRERIERDAGYGLIFSPPSLKDHESIREAFSIPATRPAYDPSVTNMSNLATNTNLSPGAASRPTLVPTPTPAPKFAPVLIDEDEFQIRIDTTRLLIQCAVALFLTLGGVVFLHRS
jgi:hypothetical protein